MSTGGSPNRLHNLGAQPWALFLEWLCLAPPLVGVGVKVGLPRALALTGKLRRYSEDTGGGPGSCGPNCIVIPVGDRPSRDSYGRRASLGLQAHLGW